MGAKIKCEGRIALVEGVKKLSAAKLVATDLRGGAALAVAALQAEGESAIGDLQHIDRGYEDLARDLRAMGAEVRREER